MSPLEKSILKWERVARGDGVDGGAENCALCKEYMDTGCVLCQNCPVANYVETRGCEGTPFTDWSNHQIYDHLDDHPFRLRLDCPECQKLAEAELGFLKEVLDNETSKQEQNEMNAALNNPFPLGLVYQGDFKWSYEDKRRVM